MNRMIVGSVVLAFSFVGALLAQSPKTPYPSTELQPQLASAATPDGDATDKVEMISGKITRTKGGQYILYDPATEKSFQLDDQKAVAKYDRKSVAISGTLDTATNTIHVQRIFRG